LAAESPGNGEPALAGRWAVPFLSPNREARIFMSISRWCVQALLTIVLIPQSEAAVVVTTSTECTLGDEIQNDPVRCGTSLGPIIVDAGVDYFGYDIDGNSFRTRAQVLSQAWTALTQSATPTGNAQAAFTFDALFTTPGPVRPGLIALLMASDQTWDSLGDSSARMTVGDYTLDCAQPNLCISAEPMFRQFMLGQPFSVTISALAQSSTPNGVGATDAIIAFTIYEHTEWGPGGPVPLLEPVPEPRFLGAGGLIVLFAARRLLHRT
jgi:hypothetical protein